MILTIAKLIGISAIKTFLFWLVICTIGFAINEIYSYVTVRTKIIKLKSIVNARAIIDEDHNAYNIMSNHLLGCSDLHNKISKLKIESYYTIKIYGIESPFTKINLIDIKSC